MKMTTKEKLAMYRNALYAAMGVRNGEALPTDRQCLVFLAGVMQHATMYQIGPYLPSVGDLPFDWRTIKP